MKWSTEIYTRNVEESKRFYTQYFGFIVQFELEGFVVLQHKVHSAYKLLFCVPDSPFVNEIFRPEFCGRGVIFQLEVENVDEEYRRMKALGIPITLGLTKEEVNGKHFTVTDPNGIYIDIVEYEYI